jgi:hypothetical protein
LLNGFGFPVIVSNSSPILNDATPKLPEH